jgi:hypothetical protein
MAGAPARVGVAIRRGKDYGEHPAPPRASAAVARGVYDNRPLVFVDEKDGRKGVYIDLLEHIAPTEGWQLQYVAGTWHSVSTAGKRAIDLLAAIAYSEDRRRVTTLTSATWSELGAGLYAARRRGQHAARPGRQDA